VSGIAQDRTGSHRIAQNRTTLALDHFCIRCFGLRIPAQQGAPSGGILKAEAGTAPADVAAAMHVGGPGTNRQVIVRTCEELADGCGAEELSLIRDRDSATTKSSGPGPKNAVVERREARHPDHKGCSRRLASVLRRAVARPSGTQVPRAFRRSPPPWRQGDRQGNLKGGATGAAKQTDSGAMT